MKRIKMKITKHLKTAMLCFALFGGTYGASRLAANMTPVLRVKYAFTIGLVAAFKKSKKDLSEDEESMLKTIEDEINAKVKTWKEGVIEKAELDEYIKGKSKEINEIVDLKTIKIGEGDKAKTLEQILTEHGEDITKALKLGGGTAVVDKKKFMDQFTEEKWGEIEKAFRSKSKGDEVVISLKAAAIMTTDNTIDSTALDGVDITENFRVDSFVPKRYDTQFIFDIADRVTVAEVPEFIMWYEEGNAEGAIAIVAESGLKPLTSFELVKNLSTYQKAAGKMVITEEFAKFRKRAWQIIRSLFNDKVLRDYQNILTENLLAEAVGYTGTALDGTIISPNDFDAIGAVCAQLETLNFAPDTIIINPQDKWRLMLTKDTTGNYLTNVAISGANGQVQIMSLKTIVTNKVAVGTCIIGEGRLWKIEEEAVQIRIGYGITMNGGTAESDFDYNRLRMIGELFFHNYIPSLYLGSFVQFTFTDVKETIASEVVAQG